MNRFATESLLLSKVKEGLCQWMKLNLLLLAFMILVRMLFFLEVHVRMGIESSFFWGMMKGSLFDFYLFCRMAAFMVIPFLALYVAVPKLALTLYKALLFLYAVVMALLMEYYCNLSMPLDHVILVYTPEEVRGTAASSASLTLAPFLWFFAVMAIMVGLVLLWKKVKLGFYPAALLLLVAVVLSCCIPYKTLIREERYYPEHRSFCLAVNQPSYSYIKLTDYLRDTRRGNEMNYKEVDSSVLEAAERYQALHPEFDFLDPEYPFYRKADDPDVLGPYLEMTDDSLPPNLVFIIVESLGQHLTGVEHPSVSFTPFIDSLKQQGLYWENCLSTAERTFGVLPSVFASVPYGKYGFCTSNRPMPDHHSLLRDLKSNGYVTNYYYGGVHSFDRFDAFLKANKVDYIYLPEMQHVDSATYHLLDEAHRWGLDDKETVRQLILRQQSVPVVRPQLDIIMTLSTHEPFLVEDIKTYEWMVMETLAQHPEASEREREIIKANTNIYACFRYMDDAVRELVRYYQTLPEYRNTLFVLTGDHRMGPLNFTGPLSKYHVPLLIFSPLVKQPRTMKSVVSHLDITPTLNAYLQTNYAYHTDSECHWMGTSLDTTVTFRNTRKQAFMLNNRDVVEYVDSLFLLSNNHVFSFDEQLVNHWAKDQKVIQWLKPELNDFNVVSQFAVLHDHLNLKRKGQETLKSLAVNFESRYDKYYKHHVTKIGDNHVARVDTTKVYGPLMKAMKLTVDYQDIYLDIAFDLQGLDTLRALPMLVVELGDYYVSAQLNSEEETSLNTGEKEHFQAHISIAVPDGSEGKLLKAYLHNNAKTTMIYDNLQIRVSAKR